MKRIKFGPDDCWSALQSGYIAPSGLSKTGRSLTSNQKPFCQSFHNPLASQIKEIAVTEGVFFPKNKSEWNKGPIAPSRLNFKHAWQGTICFSTAASPAKYPPIETDKNMPHKQRKITLFNFIFLKRPNFCIELGAKYNVSPVNVILTNGY